jgi:hypothetical protein
VVDDLPAEEAFKIVLSTGNYTPRQLGLSATAALSAATAAAPAGPSASAGLPNARPVVQ